ncbi:hypothetical protein HK098_008162 [Nowakowskiella sp. JEL0407]|nr:hypothetical protein HK098_008162 [Nowakowskiella sp. JEL0407]
MDLEWRRNNLSNKLRFQSPLYIQFNLSNPSSPVKFSHSPFPLTVNYLSCEIHQNLETVNCLWDASTVLCGYVTRHRKSILDKCIRRRKPFGVDEDKFRILELGSGCGVLGVVMGKLFSDSCGFEGVNVDVVVTDMDDEVTVIEETLECNFHRVEVCEDTGMKVFREGSNTTIRALPLKWGDSNDWRNIQNSSEPAHVDLIVGTDVVYEIQAFYQLLSTMNDICPIGSPTLFLMCMERRWKDVEAFWWETVQENGWKWEYAERDVGCWWDLDKIDIIWLYR